MSPTAPATAVPNRDAESSKIAVVGHSGLFPAGTIDPWGLVGTTVNIPNSLWAETDGGRTTCVISFFLNRFTFGSGGAHVAYAVSLEDDDDPFHYCAVRADYIARCLSPEERAKLRKKTKLPKPSAP